MNKVPQQQKKKWSNLLTCICVVFFTDNPSLFNWMTSLVPDKETRNKAARYVANIIVKSYQSIM
jgi:hypothetical protein